MAYAAQSILKASEKSEPILHWELPHSVPCGCDTMHQLFNQGLIVDHSECDDCPSEDESDLPALAPHYFSDSDSSTGLEYDKFGEDRWDDLEFTTYRCDIIKVSHIPSEPIENPHDYEEDLDDTVIDSTGDVIGTYIHRVTLDDENIYHPTSVDDSIVDLKLSKLACERG
jgi:hypothetical protein